MRSAALPTATPAPTKPVRTVVILPGTKSDWTTYDPYTDPTLLPSTFPATSGPSVPPVSGWL